MARLPAIAGRKVRVPVVGLKAVTVSGLASPATGSRISTSSPIRSFVA
jgi:hypothetical protein